MTLKLKKVFESGCKVDIAKEVVELNKKVPEAGLSFATSTMIQDAITGKEDIYKLDKPIKPKGGIPRFIFL